MLFSAVLARGWHAANGRDVHEMMSRLLVNNNQEAEVKATKPYLPCLIVVCGSATLFMKVHVHV